MKYVIITILLSVVFVFKTVLSYGGITIGELPKDITDEIKHIQNHFLNNLKPDCETVHHTQLDFLLYKRDNYDTPTLLDPTNPKDINPQKKTILIIHGWLQTSNSSGIIKLKNAYLKRYDSNVILVDWSLLSQQPYTSSYCHMQRMGIQVSRFLCQISAQLFVALSELHVVGFSVGGQLAGVTAQYVKSKCKQQLGRITGLDPAGPLFQNLPVRRRLDKSDAKFVDIIHTDQMKFGVSGNMAHSDFYPNCGQLQPGCTSVKDMQNDTTVEEILCSHHRSLEYMIESIQSDHFVGLTCIMCPRYCRGNVIGETYGIMGEGATIQPSDSKFYLTTKNVPPFGEGWTLHSAKLP